MTRRQDQGRVEAHPHAHPLGHKPTPMPTPTPPHLTCTFARWGVRGGRGGLLPGVSSVLLGQKGRERAKRVRVGRTTPTTPTLSRLIATGEQP